MKRLKCDHGIISYDKDYQTVCGECGDIISLVFDDSSEEAYFEILHAELDGSFTAFHRSYKEQLELFSRNLNLH